MKSLVLLFILSFLSFSASWADGSQNAPALSLADALAKANVLSVQVLTADARVQGAIGRLALARSAVLPQLSGTAALSRQTDDLRGRGIQLPGVPAHVGPFNALDARLKVTQAIFDVGAIERLRAAAAGRELSKAQLLKAKEDVLALVATMYVQALRAQEQVGFVKNFMTRDRLAYSIARLKYKQGTGSFVELRRSRSDYSHSQFLYRSARAAEVQTSLDLGAALKFPAGERPILRKDSIDAVLDRGGAGEGGGVTPEVQVAEGQVTVERAQVAAARADYVPKVTAAADYGRAGENPSRSSNTYSVGLRASVPLWEGGSKQAAVMQEAARLKEAEAGLDDARLRQQAAVAEARENVAQAQALVRAGRDALALSRDEHRVAQARFTAGTGQQLDVVLAQAQLAAVEDNLGEAQARLWLAKINLAHALGRMRILLTDQGV